MSRRNPQNERYTVEQEGRRAGSTAPKAGSAKPASKAAASVRIQTSKSSMSKKQKVVAQQTMTKEEKKAQRAQERELENLVYTATTVLTNKDEKYKKLRRIWWGLLIAAVVFTALSLVLAYAGIIGALIMDFTVIRKRRNVFRDKVNAMTRKQVERVVEESYAERQAADAAKKARKEAKKAGKSASEQEAAAAEAAAAVLSASSKRRADADAAEAAAEKGTVYRKAKGKGKKGAKGGKPAAEKASDAEGTTKITEVVADGAGAAETAATSETDAAAAAEEARLEAARKAARDFANSKR